MAAKKRHNIANGVLSVFVLSSGIAFCVLAACLLRSLHEYGLEDRVFPEKHHRGHHRGHHKGHHGGHHEEEFPFPEEKMEPEPAQKGGMEPQSEEMPSPYDGDYRKHHGMKYLWTAGLIFVVTGILGVISAFVRRKGLYITHMVFGIVTLVLKTTMVIFTLCAMKKMKHMHMDPCRDDMPDRDMCEGFTIVKYKTLGLGAIVIVGLILTLVTTILSGILGCGRKKDKAEITKAAFAAAIVQAPELPSKTGYFPQVHDKADLVGNMELSK